MRKPTWTVPVVACLILTAGSVFGQTPDVTIRLNDEQVYFPDSPIEILVTIDNTSPQRVSFELADDRSLNMTVVARDGANRPVDGTTRRRANQVLYRTVSLLPGERISFVDTLTDYVALDAPDHYTVHVEFALDPIDGSMQRITSNSLIVTVRPGETQQVRTEMRMRESVRTVLQRERLSPDEVVTELLLSRQNGNWERFFLYLDLESLYLDVPARADAYRNMSETQQLAALADYRERLRSRSLLSDDRLVVVPDDFMILETRYSATTGTVVADLFFDAPTYREVRRYTYTLQRRDGYWEIVAYEVNNLQNRPLPE